MRLFIFVDIGIIFDYIEYDLTISSKMKILIVDDEKTVRKALRFALQKNGHEILEANNCKYALELINIHSFDLLIIDYNLPAITGIELLQKLNNQGKTIPAFIMSSNSDLANHYRENFQVISKDLPVKQIIHIIESTNLQPTINQRR